MQDILTSIKAYLYDRAVSPLTGAFIVSWVIWNYRFFIILFSTSLTTPTEKFKEIDLFFKPYTLEISEATLILSGRLIDGAIAPILIAFGYLYIYPFFAKPVYEHSLNKQKELRAIKQEQENQKLLSVEESRELYRRFAQMQSKHQAEVDSLNNQISSLSTHIETIEKSEITSSKIEPLESEEYSAPLNDEELKNYDEYINDQVENREIGLFYLNQLFGQNKWSEIPVTIRQNLGKRFRAQVERGDFVGVTTNGKNTGNQQQYKKSPQY